MKKRFLLPLVFVLVAIFSLTAHAAGEEKKENTIPEGVYIGDTSVGGLTVEEARAILYEREEEMTSGVFTLRYGDREVSMPFSEMGLVFEDTTDLIESVMDTGTRGTLLTRYKELKQLEEDKVVCDWSFSYDASLAEPLVDALAEIADQSPINATISRYDNQFHVTASQNGIVINREETLQKVRESLADWKGGDVVVEAAATETEPRYTYEALSSIQTIMADFVTAMGANFEQGRSKNVKRGAELLNGIVLLPGETLSVYSVLAPFTTANGYDFAHAFSQGGYIDSLGGGICSLSSTLYNALMYAELQINRRYNHSMLVSYTRPGFDATINDDASKDLVFTNNYPFPIYIEAWTRQVSDIDGQCYFAIWGTRTEEMKARDVSLYYKIIDQEDAVYIREKHEELEKGTQVEMQSAYPRMVVEAYKKVEVNGVLVSDEYLYTDYYIRSDGIIWYND